MNGLLKSLVVKFIKARWGSILPAILKAAAEGDFGEPVKKLYAFAAGKKTITGAALVALGAGLETLCASFPEYAVWACPASRYLYIVGGLLASVGLVDGGTRAPWPAGTPREEK